MNLTNLSTEKVRLSRLGLEVTQDLSFEEWRSMADHLGAAMSSTAFVIGDWLVYGEHRFRGQLRLAGIDRHTNSKSKVSSETYDAALAATGLDRTTLYMYAYVSRNVPRLLRNEDLSWEHHKSVAKLEADQQEHWLQVAVDHRDKNGPLSTRRLRKSITAGRLLSVEELMPDESDRGIENHIPFINRLVAWWARLAERRWLNNASKYQRAAMKRDLQPVVDIYNKL